MTKKKEKTNAPAAGARAHARYIHRTHNPYPFEKKIRIVKAYLEEKYSTKMICEEFGIRDSTLYKWARLYRNHGEDGLRQTLRGGSSAGKIPVQVKDKIVEMKAQNPLFGVQRISDMLGRFFHMKASPETVRKTLQKSDPEKSPARKKPERNITRPRFFERATPNQMWQSDIFTFRLGGRQAYLIGFIDDYSRYMVGLGLHVSQTADNVLDVYRRAVSEYGVPKEMLTDNGRQYTSWRGNTKFERELQKDRIKHIKSQPHHPMTLGKIERFWKSIFQEFLNRAQFDTFESARERTAMWVKYYNHRRPHQGIGGLCPADRFFEIQGELRKVIERKIEENTLELALRGKPADTFYMVGRLGEKSVVLTAEKGKMKLLVDGNEKELENGEFIHEIGKIGIEEGKAESQDVYGGGEMQGGAVGVGGEAQRLGGLPGAPGGLDAVLQVAGSGTAGYIERARDEEGSGQMSASGRTAGEAPGAEGLCAGQEAGEHPGEASREAPPGKAGGENGIERREYAGTEITGRDAGAHAEGQEPGDHREEGGGHPGNIQEDLLQVGEQGARRNGCGAGGAPERAAAGAAGGSGEGVPQEGEREAEAGKCFSAEASADQGHGSRNDDWWESEF